MYRFKQILYLDLINLIINPMWLFYAIGFPILLILILGFLTSGGYGSSVTSYDYFSVSLMIFGLFNASTFSANSFMEERIKRPNMRLVYSPIRHFNIYFSKILATFIFCSISYLLVALFFIVIFGVNFGGSSSWYVLIIMLSGNLFFSTLGVMVCCLLKDEGITNNILSLLYAIFAVLGGLFFPVECLGKIIIAVSWISPGKWILEVCFRIIYDNDLSMFLPIVILLVSLTVIALFISSRLFKGEDYL